ncbi:MAG TPA: lipoyl domain-containing protein [Candidatus Brocadiia bacterium]|nr:lipoyl domain-containing protein [Candidatus Brocadiia bacterium]
MRYEFKLPLLTDDEKKGEAEISFWYVEVGETIKEGAELVQVIVDKMTVDVPSPKTGKLVEVLMGDGEKAKPGDVMAILET